MNRERKKTSAGLASLRQKHSDRGWEKHSHLKKVVTEVSPQPAFHTSTAKLTSSGYKKSLRELYAFFFVEMSLLLLWVGYRAFENFPIWFDEGISKAVVFGLPVIWFTARSKFISREIGLDPQKMLPGLYLGTAIGGLYGFAAVLAEVFKGREVVAASLYLSSDFWWLAFLALLTAWWESLFFFGLPIQYIRGTASWISDWLIGAFVVVLFLLFHAPLRLIVTGGSPQFVSQMSLLCLFVIGQFLVYTRTKNMYALVLSHFFWGLVIEIYSR